MGLFRLFSLYKLRPVPYDCNDLRTQRWFSQAVSGAAIGRRESRSKTVKREEEV
jgi:hypothetical protein